MGAESRLNRFGGGDPVLFGRCRIAGCGRSDAWRRDPVAARAGRRSGCGTWPDDFAQGLVLVGGLVPICGGQVREAAAEAHDGDGGVREAGQLARQHPGAGARTDLVVGGVAHVVQPRAGNVAYCFLFRLV